MLTLKTLRDDPQHVIEKLAVKNFDARAIVEKVLELDTNRRVFRQRVTLLWPSRISSPSRSVDL